MANLILGPAVRYVSDHEATVWVETDGPCQVKVLDHTAPTMCVHGHHYALVRIGGLEPDAVLPYEVELDGEVHWPPPGYEWPAPRLRTLPSSGRLRVCFGSCRVSVPHEPPYTLPKDQDDRGRDLDALYALTRRMVAQDPVEWPHVALMLGDQVYADEVSPDTSEFIAARRDTSQPPGEQIADFEEYTRLYRESWSDPSLRWFMSCVSSSMIWDDHDVHDDWNTSRDWVDEIRTKPWWEDRITGGIASYWLYQHIGNLSPDELDADELWQAVCGCDDASDLLHDFAQRADRESEGTRWSFYRDLGRTRLIMMDSRGGRVLEPDCRSMVDKGEWEWIAQHAQGDFDHLLLGTSLPILLSPAMHHLEAWNEAVCDGAWGGLVARAGEWIRQELDLEHWAAFDESFDNLCALMQAVAVGHNGRAPPASIVALSGDVHHAYLAEVAFRRGSRARSAVYQAVCSPVRNPLDATERRTIKAGFTKGMEVVAHGLARAAGHEDPTIRWRTCDGPYFDNQLGTLDIDGRSMVMRLERARAAGDGGTDRDLEPVMERRLA